MHMTRSRIHIGGSALAGLLLIASGCQQPQTSLQTSSADLPQLDRLYAKATQPTRRMVRKPVRDEQQRAMRELGRQADVLLAQSADWDSGPRLVSLEEPKQNEVRSAVEDFRASLTGLRQAAATSDVRELRTRYAAAKANYRRIVERTGPIE